MSRKIDAWRLEVSDHTFIAIGQRCIAEYVKGVKPVEVPFSPLHIRHVVEWRNQIIPLATFDHTESSTALNTCDVVITGYNSSMGREYVALKILSPPKNIRVDDKNVCYEVGGVHSLIRQFAVSVFSEQEMPVAVVNLDEYLYQYQGRTA